MHNKKKILFLITKSSLGGAQRYVFDLATNIDKERYEPIIALGGTGELYEELRAAGLQVVSIKGLGRNVSLFKDLVAGFHIAYLIAKIRPTVLHVNSSKVGVLGTLLGRLLFIPNVIFTAHGWAFNEERPTWQKTIIKCLQWLTVLFSHTTIVVSKAVKRDLNWPLVARKMTVVPLGRTVNDIRSPEDARGALAMKVRNNSVSLNDYIDDIWLGSVAELHHTKGLDVAINAISLLINEHPKLRYIIMHDGEEREHLEAQVRNLNLTKHVFFTGTVPEAARLISAFDIFVLPSRSEAFGYVLIEAGQAGVPIVASNVGGIPEIIAHRKTGLLVPSDDAHQLAAAIHEYVSDEKLRREMAVANYTNTQGLSLQKMINSTQILYDL